MFTNIAILLMTWKKSLTTQVIHACRVCMSYYPSFSYSQHISYRFVLNYSCEAIKSIYVYACLHTHTHIKKKTFLSNVTCFDLLIIFYPLLSPQPCTSGPNLFKGHFLFGLNRQKINNIIIWEHMDDNSDSDAVLQGQKCVQNTGQQP